MSFLGESGAFSQRSANSFLAGTPLTPADFDPRLHGRRMAWEPRAHLVAGRSPLIRCTGTSRHAMQNTEGSAWIAYNRDTRLNLHEARHPYWVSKAPGTGFTTQERWNLSPSQPAHKTPFAPPGRAGWDASFTVAHVLDRNPVFRGNRRLPASRPKFER